MDYIRSALFIVLAGIITTGCGGGASNPAPIPPPPVLPPPGEQPAITLQWVAPTTRVDGTAASLNEISGYRIYYGPYAEETTTMVEISGGLISEHTLQLPPNTYYFRISAIDTNGYEGPKSPPIIK